MLYSICMSDRSLVMSQYEFFSILFTLYCLDLLSSNKLRYVYHFLSNPPVIFILYPCLIWQPKSRDICSHLSPFNKEAQRFLSKHGLSVDTDAAYYKPNGRVWKQLDLQCISVSSSCLFSMHDGWWKCKNRFFLAVVIDSGCVENRVFKVLFFLQFILKNELQFLLISTHD